MARGLYYRQATELHGFSRENLDEAVDSRFRLVLYSRHAFPGTMESPTLSPYRTWRRTMTSSDPLCGFEDVFFTAC